ncbi:transcription initiation factor TFIID subunit 4 [Drosophila eugracilis]|uniref:transcription initiation factor TFIID subunit 4 n=1 Tax=Drosophila eugracilis TaxID=29029 RepID=UPI001BD9AB4D|nr:transcription initiation factor TFIID subunit 4 [Drosophila eugracilis]
MSRIPVVVPIQPYAGPLLIIKDLILPESGHPDPNKTNNPTKKKARNSFFDRNSIQIKLAKLIGQGSQGDEGRIAGNDVLLDAFLAALETYMKFVITKIIELCEHRSGHALYNDDRCVMKNDTRTTMMFLNDLEMADYGSSDDDSGFYRKRRAETAEYGKSGVAFKSTLDTVSMAFTRKRPAEAPATEGTSSVSNASSGSVVPIPRPYGQRYKHLNIRDVLQFMEENRRYSRSNMLFEAYLKYKS